MALSQQIQAEVKSFVESTIKLDTSSKALFQSARGLYKPFRGDKANTGKITKDFTAELKKHSAEDAIIKRAKAVLKLAADYVEFDFLTKFDVLRWYNIEALVKLGSAVKKDEKITEGMIQEIVDLDEDVEMPTDTDLNARTLRAIREVIKNLYQPGITDSDYNNAVNTALGHIRHALQYSDVDGAFERLEKQLKELVEAFDLSQIVELRAILAAREAEIALEEQAEEQAETAEAA
jgi:hypothetical protein